MATHMTPGSLVEHLFERNVNLCVISGSRGGKHEDDGFLQSSAMSSCWSWLTFQRCILPSSFRAMEAVHTSETSDYFEISKCYIPKSCHLQCESRLLLHIVVTQIIVEAHCCNNMKRGHYFSSFNSANPSHCYISVATMSSRYWNEEVKLPLLTLLPLSHLLFPWLSFWRQCLWCGDADTNSHNVVHLLLSC
jgi:hypothetical protein